MDAVTSRRIGPGYLIRHVIPMIVSDSTFALLRCQVRLYTEPATERGTSGHSKRLQSRQHGNSRISRNLEQRRALTAIMALGLIASEVDP